MTIETYEKDYEFTVGSHTDQAHEYTSALIDEAYRRKSDDNPATAQERITEADRLCESHYACIGDFPAESVLSRLAWYIVFDEMTDSHPDKMTREEYPIMSRNQFGRRMDNTVLLEDLPYGDTRYLGKRAVGSSMVTDNGEDKDDERPFIDSIRLVDQREQESDILIERLSIDDILNDAELTPRQAFVIDRIFADERTQSEVSLEMGVSQARVSHLYNGALDKLRRYLSD